MTIYKLNHREFANFIYSKIKSELGLNENEIAYKIYQRLKNEMASKAVTAQWLAKILLRYKSRILPFLKRDSQFKYIVDAIYHVTRPDA